jgi:hypothetical protein
MGTALTVLGIIISTAFGAWGIYLTIKHRYPGRITFVKQESIALFDAIVENLPELAVLYKGAPVSPDIVLIRGALVNTGAIDISPSMVDAPLKAQLPEGFEWLAAKVVSSSTDFNVSLTIDSPRTITINGNLFRRNEHVRFQALASVPSTKSSKQGDIAKCLEEAIEFSHRIANTRRVENTEIEELPFVKKRLRRATWIAATLVLITVALGVVQLVVGLPAEVSYSYKPHQNDVPIEVRIVPRRDGTVNVRGIHQKYSETLSVAEFFAKCTGNPTIIADRTFRVIVPTFVIIYMVLPAIYLLLRYMRYRKNKRLSRMLGMDKDMTEAT